MFAVSGSVIVVLGVANHRSIAWGIAKELAARGARLCLTYQGERFQGTLEKLAAEEGLKDPVLLPLDVNDDATSLASELLRRTRIPPNADVDALHVAVATVNGMDYLLSWNCKHIVNGNILPQVYSVCRSSGYEPPLICTPSELMEPSL